MNELVSIVIPVYNMGNSLLNATKSILNQTYKNIEIILVDDGSKDNSFDVCKLLANADSRVVLIHTENQGSGPARNEGIKIARGEYIFFPDADDFLESEAIANCLNAALKTQADLVVFGFKIADKKGRTIKSKNYDCAVFDAQDLRNDYSKCMDYTAEWGIQGAPWNKLFSLKTIKENNIFFPSLRRHQDDAFIGEYMSYSRKVAFINKVLYVYFINDLKREWEKYPKDYLSCVIGLYNYRKNTILRWNDNDLKTHNTIISSYIVGVIKAMELCYSKKHCPYKKDINKQIIDIIEKSKIKDYSLNFVDGYPYQKKVLKCIKKNKYHVLSCVLGIKVFFEKHFYCFIQAIKKHKM